MPRGRGQTFVAILLSAAILGSIVVGAASVLGGPLPPPLPIFPADNWWNLDISTAPVDPALGSSYIAFVGPTRALHPDFGGDVSPGSAQVYGFPYAVVDSTLTQARGPVSVRGRERRRQSRDQRQRARSIRSRTRRSPRRTGSRAANPGNVDLRSSGDRHLLIVDRDQRYLYELYNVFYDGSQWHAGSGAFFDLNANGRRPDSWTSADAAGLAILPGLVRYDEVVGHRRNQSRVSRDGAGDQRLRLSGVTPRGLDGRCTADGRAAPAEGQPRSLRVYPGSAERSSARCSVTA